MSGNIIKGRYQDVYKEVQLTKDGNLISQIDGISIETEGNKQRIPVINDEIFSLLVKILKELKKITLHMEVLSDNVIKDAEVDI